MEITPTKIEALAPNAAAAKNGRDLVSKNKFSNLRIDTDQTLIWGECAGSGPHPYICSADFADAANPVFRCNCPSRQFPCKHGIGLLYAREKGLTFAIAPVPQDIQDKRQKAEQRQDKKIQEKESLKEKAGKPRTINTTAVIKKADAQLAGIAMAQKMLNAMVQNGLSSIDGKESRNLQVQIRELGNYYIPGIQTAFQHLMLLLDAVQQEAYTDVIDQLNFISALIKKATQYLETRKQAPETLPEINSAIEEQIGTVWKLTDLIQLGLYEADATLLQLSFNSYDASARREFVDEGTWINLKTGRIYKTKNYRPYRATKYIREENSVVSILQLKDLYVYPGGINPRIRWETEASNERAITTTDLQQCLSFASGDYAALLKTVKNSIKDPLEDKNPVVLLRLHKSLRNGNDLVLEDASGNQISLRDMEGNATQATTILKQFLPEQAQGMALLAMIDNHIQTGIITAQPMTVITGNKLIKLFY